ncbi:MAG: hypothetical protein L3J39_01520 [Verrucomicrobiales bacterium]|nr:hypothetical protein [Verrucomicrobiales bacterium]
MNLITPSLRQPAHSRLRAFTALEALVMLLALFILTMLGIGLWLKKQKDNKEINPPASQSTIDTTKPKMIDPDKKPTLEKPSIEAQQKPTSKTPR